MRGVLLSCGLGSGDGQLKFLASTVLGGSWGVSATYTRASHRPYNRPNWP